MNEQIAKARLHHAVDACLSGIELDPLLLQRVMLRKDQPIMKKKISVASIAVAILLMITVTALAVGIYESIKPAMDQSAEILVGTNWQLQDKLRFIDVLRSYHLLEEDDALLAIAMDEDQNEEDRSLAASQVIDSVCGDLIRADLDPSVLQQETYLTPDLETVFTVLYRSRVPDVDDSTIAAEYERWFSESELFASTEETADKPETEIADEEEIRLMADSMLSEVYNFNQAERAATKIDINYNEEHGVWIVSYAVSADDLRSELKAEWTTQCYDAGQNAYTWTQLLTVDGKMAQASSIEEYEWNQLIPREAYPHWEDWHDDLRAFLYCSVEERAAFSAAYKPVVDAWLDANPEAGQYFLKTKSGYADRLNETTYAITRQTYGIPDEDCVAEADAVTIAREAYLNAGLANVTAEMISQRCLTAVFFITADPEQPVWKIEIAASPHAGSWNAEDHHNGYRVVIDAHTGVVLEEGELYGANPGANILESALWMY